MKKDDNEGYTRWQYEQEKQIWAIPSKEKRKWLRASFFAALAIIPISLVFLLFWIATP